jgi:uncharacterized protein YbcC (UPF0753/DUF2309 family)
MDFNKIIAERKLAGQKLLEQVKDQPTKIVPRARTSAERFNHLLEYHWDELTDWEKDFCEDQHTWHSANPNRGLSDKVAGIVKDLEDKLCGTMCHALNKAEIPHG